MFLAQVYTKPTYIISDGPYSVGSSGLHNVGGTVVEVPTMSGCCTLFLHTVTATWLRLYARSKRSPTNQPTNHVDRHSRNTQRPSDRQTDRDERPMRVKRYGNNSVPCSRATGTALASKTDLFLASRNFMLASWSDAFVYRVVCVCAFVCSRIILLLSVQQQALHTGRHRSREEVIPIWSFFEEFSNSARQDMFQIPLISPKNWSDPPERLRGVFTTKRYTNTRLPLPLPLPLPLSSEKLWPWPKIRQTLELWSIFCLVICLTRNSSGDEIANVNFLYDDIVHALKIQ